MGFTMQRSIRPGARRWVSSDSRIRSQIPGAEILEGRQLLTTWSNLALDLGTTSSPTAENRIGVPVVAVTPDRGYGWIDPTGIRAVERNGPNALKADFHTGRSGTFEIDVAPGRYVVTTVVGDQKQAHTGMTLTAEHKALAANVATMAGDFIQSSVAVNVTDGKLDIGVAATGPTGFALDGIQIRQVKSLAAEPTVEAGPNQTAVEGTAVAFAGKLTGLNVASAVWSFGDGSGTTGTLTPQHVYQDNGTYLATLTVADPADAIDLQSTVQIVVTNAPPQAVVTGAPADSPEGTPITLGASVTDPSPVDARAGFAEQWTVLKDGSVYWAAATPSLTFIPDDNGTYVVTLTATDKDGGGSPPATQIINVTDVAPSASAGGPYQGVVGQAVSFDGGATDPSSVDTTAGLTESWDFGDGSTPVSGTGLLRPQHVYAAAGTYTVVATATDKDGAISAPASTPVTIGSAPASDLGSVQLTPGWATFGEVLPEGAATGSLMVGSLPTQTDVKTVWPDGSIRDAVVTVNVTTAGSYPINPGPAAQATVGAPTVLTPTIPAAAVQLTIGGVLYTAALPAAPTNDRWLDGPLVSEWRATVTPVTAAGQVHPFLRVIFDTRAYRTGQDRLDVTVENDLDVAGAAAVTYDAKVVANGQTLFSQSNVAQAYLTRWRKVYDLGFAESRVTHDFQSFVAAGAIPAYSTAITNQDYSTDDPNFAILGRGGNTYDYMGSTGGRTEIAPYPDWTARYLVDQTPDQAAYVMANGDLAGSWPVHLREPDGSLVSIDQRPNFWLDYRGTDTAAGDTTPTSPLTPDLAHVPSLAYVPYLATGDRYYADEMAFWGNYGLISTYPASIAGGGRGGSQGIVGTDQVRSRAWALRNLADAAAYLPDSDPEKAYLSTKVENNLHYYDAYAQSHVTPLGTVLERFDTVNGQQVIEVCQWQNNYLAWSLDHAQRQGFTGGQQLEDRILAFQVKLFSSGSDYPREYGAPYYPIIGTVASDGTDHYFTTMAQMFQANFVNADGTTAPPVPFVGYYGIDAQLSLTIAVDQGLPGAQAASDWLSPQVAGYVADRAGWAITMPKKKP